MSETLISDALSSESLAGYDALREDCGLVDLNDHLALLEVRGEDRKAWLQGQITNDVRPLQIGGAFSFCVCLPTGQIVAICDGWRLEDRYLITTNTSSIEALKERLQAAIIMEDVQVNDLTQDYQAFSVQGPTATRRLGDLLAVPTMDAGFATLGKAEVLCLRTNRTGLGGWDVLVPAGTKTPWTKDFEKVDDHAYRIAQLEAGIPRQGLDTDAKTLPPELGPAFTAKHVSFSKGCYTGQEVLMRIHSRGHTNKTWVGLFTESFVPVGTPLIHMGKNEVGVIASSCDSPSYGPIAAAYVRNEAAFDGEELMAGDVPCELRHMPLLRLE